MSLAQPSFTESASNSSANIIPFPLLFIEIYVGTTIYLLNSWNNYTNLLLFVISSITHKLTSLNYCVLLVIKHLPIYITPHRIANKYNYI